MLLSYLGFRYPSKKSTLRVTSGAHHRLGKMTRFSKYGHTMHQFDLGPFRWHHPKSYCNSRLNVAYFMKQGKDIHIIIPKRLMISISSSITHHFPKRSHISQRPSPARIISTENSSRPYACGSPRSPAEPPQSPRSLTPTIAFPTGAEQLHLRLPRLAFHRRRYSIHASWCNFG